MKNVEIKFVHSTLSVEIHTAISRFEIDLPRQMESYHRWEMVPKLFIKTQINLMTTTKKTCEKTQLQCVKNEAISSLFQHLHFQRWPFFSVNLTKNQFIFQQTFITILNKNSNRNYYLFFIN